MTQSHTPTPDVTARIEFRLWYVNGEYIGRKGTVWSVVDAPTDAQRAHANREIESVQAMIRNGSLRDEHGEIHHYPCRTGDWGEYRIVTIARAALAAVDKETA